MSSSLWDPVQYERFERERKLPFLDLLSLLEPVHRPRVLDLGCGTGALTRELHAHLQASETVGIDASLAMLERARPLEGNGLRFERQGIEEDISGQWDILFSNAALQWVGNHCVLFQRLADLLGPGGQLAVQMPSNFQHVSHVTAARVAREEPFASALGGWQREVPVLTPEHYATLLHRLGFTEQSVELRVYGHLLAGPEAVIEWVKGTLLTDYAARLSPALYAGFLERYSERILETLGPERPYFYAFPRLLLWAGKPGNPQGSVPVP